MYDNYFIEWEVKPEFEKEYVSLWPCWLGADNLHKLNEVTERQWSKFNLMIRKIASAYELQLANRKTESLSKICNVGNILSSYEESLEKESVDFTRLVIPELECVLSEDWDYTYIIWHKNNGAIGALESCISEAGLFHFDDKSHNKAV